ncbi:MerR family transcriptional regulator [Spirillospora sp. CA-253888]
MDGTWTIGELAERAAAALLAVEPVQANGRVRDLPNTRLIRWYTTIGLVDPPLARRGRVALYGPRHLLQIVAVKRRQSAGRTIAEIQVELAAATDTMLERIAGLPAAAPPDPPDAAAPATEAAPSHPEAAAPAPGATTGHRLPDTDQHEADPTAPSPASGAREAESRADARARFWSARPDAATPSDPAPPSESAAPSGAASETDRSSSTPSDTGPKPTLDISTPAHLRVDLVPAQSAVVQAVRLAPDLTVLLDVATLTRDDVTAIQDAARPLLDELRRRGLISASPTPLSGRST